jgi:hypothetical protein
MIRVALEQVEPDKDVENFVRDYNTGPQIPDPPAFVDYNTLEAGQRPSRPSWRHASFARSSNRAVSIPLRQPPAEEETITPGHAGIGAGGGRSENGTSSRPLSITARRAVSATVNGIPSTGSISSARSAQPGVTPAPSSGAVSSQQGAPKQGPNPTGLQTGLGSSQHGTPKQGPVPTNSQSGPSQSTNMPQALPGLAKSSSPSYRAPQAQDPDAEPIDPRAETLLKVGTNAYPVNLGDDPQQSRTGPNGSVGGNVGEQDDPLAKQAKALRDASVRRGNDRPSNGPARQPPGPGVSASVPVASGSGSSISHAGGKNYQAQAESLVGGPSPSVARTASPNPPTANFMVPPGNRPVSPLPVEEVVSTYQQHFPGEPRSLSISRPNSVNGGQSGEQNTSASASGAVARPVSPAREGHVGIGAHGSSRSPSPHPISRSASPTSIPMTQSQQHQRLSFHAPPMQQGPLRATSPLGIAIDATGRVSQDSLADRMYGHQHQALQQETQRRTSYYGGPPPPGPPPQQAYDGFTAPRDAGNMYGQPPSQRQYPQAPPQAPPPQVPPPPPQQAPTRPAGQFYNPHAPQNPQRQGTAPLYNPYAPMAGQPVAQPPAGVPQGRPQYPQQPIQQQTQYGYPDQPQPARQAYGGYNQHVPPPPSNGYQQGGPPSDLGPPQTYGQQSPQGYRAPSPAPVKRSPSPAPPVNPPTGQYTEDGQGVLFYGELLISCLYRLI